MEKTGLIARKKHQLLLEQSQGHSWSNDSQIQLQSDLEAWGLGLKGLAGVGSIG